MSKKHLSVKAEQAPAMDEAAAQAAEESREAEKNTAPAQTAAKAFHAGKPGPKVYCGPTVRGVAKQYTVYSGGIPEALENFIKKHPAAKGLLVPVERFAETRKKMETAGTAEAILYHKIKSEL